MSQPVAKKVVARIYSRGRGWAFSKNDFAGIGSREAIAITLLRLTKKGTIRRVMRGIYDYPKSGTIVPGQLGPDIYQVADALSRKHGWTIELSGETALNLLGLSTQVPGRYVFNSNGPNRQYTMGNLTLEFRKRSLKDIRARYPKTALLVNALKSLGKERVDGNLILKLRAGIVPEERVRILKDIQYVTEWIQKAIRQACRKDEYG